MADCLGGAGMPWLPRPGGLLAAPLASIAAGSGLANLLVNALRPHHLTDSLSMNSSPDRRYSETQVPRTHWVDWNSLL